MHKTACVALLSILSFSPAWAADPWEVKEDLVHQATTAVEIKLDASTVLCSAADYGSAHLKVLIPKLAALTLLDHQNFGAGAPCVAAGACAPFGNHHPDQILDPAAPTETVDVTVQAIRQSNIDHVGKACEVVLIERVNVTIRGVPFFHERRASLGHREYQDCL